MTPTLSAPAATQPHLLLNFDVNGTLILRDTSKHSSDEDMLIHALAWKTIAQWDETAPAMPFKEYVQKVLLPGDKSNAALKVEREAVIRNFFGWMEEKAHPIRAVVMEEYRTIIEKFTDTRTSEVKFSIFPSFYRLLEKLREMRLPFTIIFRTFGGDLPYLLSEVQEHHLGVKVRHIGRFADSKLELDSFESAPGKGKETRTLEKCEEIFDHFLTSGEHFAIRDNWTRWNLDGERGRSGKSFFYDSLGNRRGVSNLSLFFDDNITGAEQDIISPCDISGKKESVAELYERTAFRVDTVEAMRDDEYFTTRVLAAIARSQGR